MLSDLPTTCERGRMLNQCPFVVWIDDILGQISEIKTNNENKADVLGVYLL